MFIQICLVQLIGMEDLTFSFHITKGTRAIRSNFHDWTEQLPYFSESKEDKETSYYRILQFKGTNPQFGCSEI